MAKPTTRRSDLRTATALLFVGCTGAGRSPAVDAGSPDAGATPVPAALTPCPMGWREVAPSGPADVTTCDPWRAGGPSACAVDEAQLRGDAACMRIGSACPVGVWPEGLPTDLHDGPVSGGPIGANVQVVGYAIERLEDRVSYADNDVNFDGTALPVPPPSPSVGP